MAATKFWTIFAGVIGVIALGIYLFGIPPEMKRKMERQALKTMGENKMSYMVKDQISKVPASDQENVKALRDGLGNAAGGLMSNPIGEATGRAASQAWDSVSDLSKTAYNHVSSTGAWDSVQDLTAKTFERVSTMTRTRNSAKEAGTTRKTQ